MIYRELGKTGLLVSEICMGVLTIGPLQKNLPLEEGARVLAYALKKGINFFDTAKAYRTYPYIRKAIEMTGVRPIIASKSYDYTYNGMKNSVKEAMEEMNLSSIDIFLLHEQESFLTIKGHRDALEYLLEAKHQGIIKAVGISTHSIEAVVTAANMPEIDVIHPLINIKGLGILDGPKEEMLAAIKYATSRHKGIYAMKIYGGGNIRDDAYEAFQFIQQNHDIHSMAIGMKSEAELDLNTAWAEGERNQELESEILGQEKKLHIDTWCKACGKCVDACRYNALEVIDDKLIVNERVCVYCGYCAAFCEDFCIKIV